MNIKDYKKRSHNRRLFLWIQKKKAQERTKMIAIVITEDQFYRIKGHKVLLGIDPMRYEYFMQRNNKEWKIVYLHYMFLFPLSLIHI